MHDPWVEDLEALGERLSSDRTDSALDSAMPVTSGMLLFCWRNEARAAVREPGWVPKDRGRLWRRDTMSALECSYSANYSAVLGMRL